MDNVVNFFFINVRFYRGLYINYKTAPNILIYKLTINEKPLRSY